MTPAERKALNQATFREANEKLEELAIEVGMRADDRVPFLCECPDVRCADAVLVALADYEEVRSVSERGLAACGHEHPDVEHVVSTHDGYIVTEKLGRAGEVHVETDLRRE